MIHIQDDTTTDDTEVSDKTASAELPPLEIAGRRRRGSARS